jgi:hypothetical protein
MFIEVRQDGRFYILRRLLVQRTLGVSFHLPCTLNFAACSCGCGPFLFMGSKLRASQINTLNPQTTRTTCSTLAKCMIVLMYGIGYGNRHCQTVAFASNANDYCSTAIY